MEENFKCGKCQKSITKREYEENKEFCDECSIKQRNSLLEMK